MLCSVGVSPTKEARGLDSLVRATDARAGSPRSGVPLSKAQAVYLRHLCTR
ncbi:MAG: hypothetical protein NZ556_00405 [Fimbriimonadales bacterium]|nr:hypothetical protein [Fimbriimonadales bacterium]